MEKRYYANNAGGTGRKRGRPRKIFIDLTEEQCSSLPNHSVRTNNLLDKNQENRTVKMGDSADLLAILGRSCKGHVDLSSSWLTEKEIAKYTSVSSQSYSTKISLRDVPRTNADMFDTYKKSRELYLNRKLHPSSTEMTNIEGFSGDDLDNNSGEEYSKGSRAHKRKRLGYEDDLEWSPNSDSKHHLTERRAAIRKRKIGLRVNTRRKRIESSSSSDGDFYYDQAEYQTTDKFNAEKLLTPDGEISESKDVSSVKKRESDTSNAKRDTTKITRDSAPLIDTDLLSKIMHEMSDYTMKNSKPSSKSNENGRITKSNDDQSNAEIDYFPQVKKRKSHVFKITDEDVTPSLTSVQQILRKMVNQVCSSEKKRKLLTSPGGSRKKICKWCDVPITNNSNKIDNDLCTRCRNVVKDSLNRTKASKIGTSSKPKAGNKIKTKLYKNLPKYDQQRLVYSGQADKSSVNKGYNHCKSFVTPKNLGSTESVVKNTQIKSPEKIKLKKKTKNLIKKKNDSADDNSNSKIIKKKKKGIFESEKNYKLIKPKINNLASLAVNKTVGQKKQKEVSVTNVNKGLFLMTFPEPHQELEIPAKEINAVSVYDKNVEKSSGETIQTQTDLSHNKSKQSMTNNVQYGNYLLPPVPTVVVANYAATDAKSGDYYLSSVYYQNEMTRTKNTPLRSEGIVTVAAPGSLPSMPSLDQFTTVSPSPTFSFPQPACHLNSLPITEFSLPAGMNTSNSLLLQQHVISPTNISLPTYSLQDNTPIFNPHEVATASYQASIESDISALLDNSELHIQSLQPKDSDDAFNLFDSQELNLAEAYEDNSNLTVDNCNEDFGAIIRKAVGENLNSASFDNDSRNSETQTKRADNTESMDTDSSKVPEQNTDLNQSSSVAGNSFESEENLFYQSETENLSSEALLEYCSSELDALCILGVVDLDKNPKWTLKRRLDYNKNEVEKLKNSETQDKKQLKNLELNGRTLQIASVLLNRFGSFTRLSDSILRKQRLLQIKKEKGLELEETRPSCQFASSAPLPPIQYNQIEPIKTIDNTTANVRLKMENAESCSFSTRSGEPINHIEKIQTQIQSMQENPIATVSPGQLELVHHFPVPGMPVASNITPRTEMISEFRETPSRGSGPRTPARPESAMSQNDDAVLTPQQIKKERLETSNPDLSQCAFSQNTTPSPRYLPNTTPTSTPNMQTIPSGNNIALVPVNTQLVNTLSNQNQHTATPTASINNSNSQIQKVMQQAAAHAASMNSNNMQIQKVMQMHPGQVGPPNVTIPFPGNQNYNKVVVSKQVAFPPPTNVMTTLSSHPSTNVIVRNNYMNVQPVNVPGATGGQMFQRYVQSSVPAVNSNAYAYKQAMNSGGTMLVNNMGQNYALANTQVMNQQQMSRVYNTGNVQQSMPAPNSVNPAPPNTAYLMPNSKPEDPTPMTCAVCNKPATLRCKQCAKVAYCNTVCAKNYWHERHKMECKVMLGSI